MLIVAGASENAKEEQRNELRLKKERHQRKIWSLILDQRNRSKNVKLKAISIYYSIDRIILKRQFRISYTVVSRPWSKKSRPDVRPARCSVMVLSCLVSHGIRLMQTIYGRSDPPGAPRRLSQIMVFSSSFATPPAAEPLTSELAVIESLITNP